MSLLDVDGPAAPPRSNGELVFAEPWESRAFGLVVTLHDAGMFSWNEFRDHLVARIAEWERDHPPGERWSYYRCWLQALESVLVVRGTVGASEVAARAEALADRPAGHDHADHDH
ncbi:MAG: nitrile hydratase accessory protein [Actinobacteria bacterium]|nr:nitrile hydratase accessory protein [Actinomycetota bacterium]